MKKIFLSLILFTLIFSAFAQDEKLSLAGEWTVKLDSLNIGTKEKWQNINFGDKRITLPGTLDDAEIGATPDLDIKNLNKEILTKLTRKHRYVGVAWYQKDITISENVVNAEIFLERIIWKTECWVDGKYLGSQNSLSAAQKFYTGKLKKGKHTIILKIDNSKQHDISLKDMAHAYTDGTQIIWNGVIGSMFLRPFKQFELNEFKIYPDAQKLLTTVNVNIKSSEKTVTNHQLKYSIYKAGKQINTIYKTVNLNPGQNSFVHTIDVKNPQLWDEFTPDLYQIKFELLDKKEKKILSSGATFGFRKFTNKNAQLQLNEKRIFLRGTLDCNIYPLKGYPPMDKVGWEKVINTAKNYGLNHIRFHSWCPPKAAFEVADSLGLYLQVELPFWSLTMGEDKQTLQFLESEAQQIISNYGNHPSFCFFSMGNELQGDFNWLNALVNNLKKQDNRRFYTATTFTFEKGHGRSPEPNDDFFITQYTQKGWVRGQGVFNAELPNFNKDYSKSVEGLTVPLITHEIGQYSVFPNLNEIDKYTGVLDPLNLKSIKYDMDKKGLLNLADSFKLASGKFAVNLYKEEIERTLKTDGISGFQLLDLHDFPGQGTALVGILDAFWDSKGLIKPEEFKSFCSPVVPLLRFEKSSYLNNENFKASIQVSNFGNKELITGASWDIININGIKVFSGSTDKKNFITGLNTLGEININLSKITKPEALTIQVKIPNTTYQNKWTIWVYPAKEKIVDNKVIFTNSKDEAIEALMLGKTVLLNPDTAKVNGVEGIFTSVFWSPVHFPNQPGTMGILCNPKHPAFDDFPTDFYSNWQWWDLIKKSKTMIIDSLPANINPVVRVVDNFFKNRKMASIIEARYGKGKLIICSIDITNDLDKRVAAKQLKQSLLKYAGTENFNPSTTLTNEDLSQLIK